MTRANPEGRRRTSAAGMQRACVAFLCDLGYLFPTLVCAKQARANAPVDTDVIIFLDSPAVTDEWRAAVEAASGVSIRKIPAEITARLDTSVPEGFFQTHVNRSALFRFFVGELAGAEYDRILYLDGDIQIRRDIGPLLRTPLGNGGVGAVRDWLALHRRAGLPMPLASSQYLDKLGLSRTEQGDYCNSGVMLATPATWNEVGHAALEFLLAHPERCRFHDQSALNYVCRGRFAHVPIRWNFLRQYMELPAYRALDPAMLHFVGKLKPWDGAYAPWSRREFQPYVEMAQDLVGLGVTWRRKRPMQRVAYHLRPWLRASEYADPTYRSALDKVVRAEDTLRLA